MRYNNRETAAVAEFFDAFRRESVNTQGVFDSTASHSFINKISTEKSDIKPPEKLMVVLDDLPDEKAALVKMALLDSANRYQQLHGYAPPADLLNQAFHLAYATTREARRKMGITLDDSTSLASDPLSLQANRAIVAISVALTEAIPFAHYLPADIQSNEARLAIMSHQAGRDYGAYAVGDLLDGAYSGDTYISAGREHRCAIDEDGRITGKITTRQASEDTCDPAAPGVRILRGRTLVYVDGIIVAREVSGSGSGPSPISGQVVLAGTTHQIGGAVNPDNGDILMTSTPALPRQTPVVVEAFIDYERQPELTPEIITAVELFTLYAKPWRVTTQQTIDSRTQMAQELGLDPYSEGVMAIQTQFANERHYEVLRKARRLAVRNTDTFDFNWMPRSDSRSRAHIWADFTSCLGRVSQRMALDTLNHGVTHLYVGETLAAQFLGLPRDFWTPSGVVERPGIFRLGTLFGRYEVYYTPKVVRETDNSAEVLCVGRATDVTRNPFILGDAVPPTVIPLVTGADLKSGAAFYARNFTSVNPHPASAKGCALINVTNLFTA